MSNTEHFKATQRLSQALAMLKKDNDNVGLRSRCVHAALDARSVAEARALLEAASAEARRHPNLRYAAANVLMAEKKFPAAQVELESLLAEGIDDLSIRVALGTCYFLANRFSDVVDLLEPAISEGMPQPGQLRLLVSSLHHLGEIERAVELADRFAAVAEGDGATAGVLALLYLDADNATGAARWASVALTANRDSIDGLITQATLEAASSQAEAAIPKFKRVLDLAPENPRAWIGLGSILLMGQHFEESRQCFEKGLQQLPDHLGTWLVLGWNHLLAEDLAGAERVFQHALQKDRNFGETHGALASVAALRGDFSTARALLEVALRLDPDCMSAQFAQAVLTGAAGDKLGARRQIAQAAMKLGIPAFRDLRRAGRSAH